MLGRYYSRFYAFYYGATIADQFAHDVLQQERVAPLTAFETRVSSDKGYAIPALPNRFVPVPYERRLNGLAPQPLTPTAEGASQVAVPSKLLASELTKDPAAPWDAKRPSWSTVASPDSASSLLPPLRTPDV